MALADSKILEYATSGICGDRQSWAVSHGVRKHQGFTGLRPNQDNAGPSSELTDVRVFFRCKYRKRRPCVCVNRNLHQIACMNNARMTPPINRPVRDRAGSWPHEAGHDDGMREEWSGLLKQLSGSLARVRDFSLFAFASPALEQQYQDYLSVHTGSHVGAMCWLLAFMTVPVCIFTWQLSESFPYFWVFTLLLALCLGVGLFRSYAPVMFRKHWHACSLALMIAYVAIANGMMEFGLLHHTVRGRLHARTVWELELYRLFMWVLLAAGLPFSLPAWGFAQVVLLVNPAFGPGSHQERAPMPDCSGFASLDANRVVQRLECLPVPWLVSAAMQGMLAAYSGPEACLSYSALCRVGVAFWDTQTDMIGAIVSVLRDVMWRRSFLRGHPHLIGHNGAARAAAWPCGSPRAAVTCLGLFLWLGSVDVLVTNTWMAAIADSDSNTLN